MENEYHRPFYFETEPLPGFGTVETTPGSSFFGLVQSSLETGIRRIGSEVLPNWAAKQMGLQSTDQLEEPMFREEYAPPRLGAPQYPPKPGAGFFDQVLFNIGTMQVTGGAIVLTVAAFVGSAVILKKVL